MAGSWTAGLMVLVGALAVPGVAQAAPPPHVPIWDNGPGGERYVAMGDSFASGPGIDPMRTDHPFCARSEKNFPTQVAKGLGVRSFTDASCGGAVLRDLWEPQVRGTASHAPQLDALGPDTSLVTLGTIGGNDVGLVGLAAECLAAGSCVDNSPDNPYVQRVEATRATLAQGIRDARARAPLATVVVVGYSTYLPREGCPALAGVLGLDEAGYFQGMVDRLSDAMKETAAAEGVIFADLRDIPGALDHTACAPVDQQWIRALGVPGDGVNFHPSAAGMAQMGWLVESVVRAERGLPPVPQPAVTTPKPTPAPSPTPAPTPEAGKTQAEVRAELRAALKTARLASHCRWSDGAARQRLVRLRLKGGQDVTHLVAKVEFRLGTRALATQRKAPFVVDRRAARLRAIGESTDWRRHRKMRARVTVRSGDQAMARTLSVRRPRCLR